MKRVRFKPEHAGIGGILLTVVLVSLGIREYANAQIHESIATEKRISRWNAGLAAVKEYAELDRFPNDGIVNPYQMRAEAERIAERHITRTMAYKLDTADHQFLSGRSFKFAILLGAGGAVLLACSVSLLVKRPYTIG